MVITAEIPALFTEWADGWAGRYQMTRRVINFRSMAIQNQMGILSIVIRSIVAKPHNDIGNRSIASVRVTDEKKVTGLTRGCQLVIIVWKSVCHIADALDGDLKRSCPHRSSPSFCLLEHRTGEPDAQAVIIHPGGKI